MTDITQSPPLSPQQASILAALRTGPHTTLELQRACGLLSIAPRIHELRVILPYRGLTIETRLIGVRNRSGDRCTVAQYSLARVRRPARRKAAARRAA